MNSNIDTPTAFDHTAPKNPIDWPDPTPEQLQSPEFEAIWGCIKGWDVGVPAAYTGYTGASGNHVRAIMDALKEITK